VVHIRDGAVSKIAIDVQTIEILGERFRSFEESRFDRITGIPEETIAQVHIDGHLYDGSIGIEPLHRIGGIHITGREGNLAQCPGLLDIRFDVNIGIVRNVTLQRLIQLVHRDVHHRGGITKPTVVIQV